MCRSIGLTKILFLVSTMKKNRLSNGVKIFILALFVFAAGSVIVLYPYRYRIKSKVVTFFNREKIRNLSSAPCEFCNELFTDGVAAHERAYKNERIKSQKDSRGLRNLESVGILKKITTNDYYLVRDMDHSDPLLLTKAVDLLNNIGSVYKSEVDKAGLPYVPFEITSATRTIESVKRLQKGNVNAIKNSPHLKGKTFDIGYINFADYPQQRALFIQVLKSFNEGKKCFVKFEVSQKCFHVTAN